MESIDFWRFVVQATLLIIGKNPSDESRDLEKFDKVKGFDAVFCAITQAIINEKLNARFRSEAYELHGFVTVGEGERFDRLAISDCNETCRIAYKKKPNWHLTTIAVDDLKAWLLTLNYKPAFFFDEQQQNNVPNYMNPNHPRYSPKLAATVKVWQAMEDENLLLKTTPKKAMDDWLRSRYK